jgi:hypothetical protein
MGQDQPGDLRVLKPKISRYMFAMFDVLGFSKWVETTDLQTILDLYHSLIETVVTGPNDKGGLSAVQTAEGAIFAVTGPPHYAYFSDTILLWCPLVPPFVDDFVARCSDLICEALAIDILLRGALMLGDAVLDSASKFFHRKADCLRQLILRRGKTGLGSRLATPRYGHFWPRYMGQLLSNIRHRWRPPSRNLHRLSSMIGRAVGGINTANVLRRSFAN